MVSPPATNLDEARRLSQADLAVERRAAVRLVDQRAVEANLAVALRWGQMVRD